MATYTEGFRATWLIDVGISGREQTETGQLKDAGACTGAGL